jgi:SAM-dependent methyltransferase
VTDKADGLRILGYFNGKGELFLIDAGMNIYKTGLMNKACYDSLLDGEWVTRTKPNEEGEIKAISHILFFDIYYFKGVNVSNTDFYVPDNKESRWFKMQEWDKAWSGNSDGGIQMTVHGMSPASRFQVKLKHFEFCDPERPNTIFARCAAVLNTDHLYHTDGLILSPNTGGLPQKSGDTFWEQFKWKPVKDNTIDFLVQFEKAPGSTIDRVEIGDPDMGGGNGYKTLRLFVGSEKDPAYDDPRATILNEGKLPESQQKQHRDKSRQKQRERRIYQPSYFIPQEYPDTMANTCNLPVHTNEETEDQYVETVDTKEPIMNNMIVEMRYDPSRNAGWRWIPMRIRHDKTERFAKGILNRTLNSELNANGVWNSIHNPISLSMITTGSEKPTLDELEAYSRRKRYYNREASKEDLAIIRGLRDFHNLWIKEKLLYKPTLSPGGKKVLDFSCGPGGDLRFWIKYKADFVLGCDIDENNIRDTKQGIYRRYMNNLVDYGRDKVPYMVFVQADSTRPLINGDAAIASLEKDREDDKNILRALFAKERPDAVTPPLVSNKLTGKLKDGADVGVSMFTLHYFLKDAASFDGFLNNLKECIGVGGYFIGCCTDGNRVFELLKDKTEGDSVVGKEGDTQVWSITKRYDTDSFRANEESIGKGFDVRFISIGEEHTEYLVNFEYLKMRLAEIGFVPFKPSGLQHSDNLFENSYKALSEETQRKDYPMSEVVKQFSFLSRWFIFKRKGETIAAEVATEVDVDVVAEEAPAPAVVTTAATTTSNLPDSTAVFQAAELFQFGPKVGLRDTFGLGEERSPKIVAPYWPFPIQDEEDGTEYPTLEHYWAAMKLKFGADKPALAVTLFSTKSGAVHLNAKAEIAKLKIKPNPNSKADKAKLTAAFLEELMAIKNIMNPRVLQKDHGAVIDPAAWNEVKDYHYRRGLQHRYDKDAIFRQIVDEAKKRKIYMLYSVPKDLGDPIGELSGVWKENGRIEGGNKIGRMIMEIAKFLF